MVVTLELLLVDPPGLLAGVDPIGISVGVDPTGPSGGVGSVGVFVGVVPIGPLLGVESAGLSVGVGIFGLLLLGCPKFLTLVVFPTLEYMVGEGMLIEVVVVLGGMLDGSRELTWRPSNS